MLNSKSCSQYSNTQSISPVVGVLKSLVVSKFDFVRGVGVGRLCVDRVQFLQIKVPHAIICLQLHILLFPWILALL